TNPKLIGKLTFSPPFVAVGAPSLHTALPLWDRNLLYVNSEAIAERCNEALNFAGLGDNRNPRRPRLISLFPAPVPPTGAPNKKFGEKGGRSRDPPTRRREARQSDLPDLFQRGTPRLQY